MDRCGAGLYVAYDLPSGKAIFRGANFGVEEFDDFEGADRLIVFSLRNRFNNLGEKDKRPNTEERDFLSLGQIFSKAA